jgi:hypothetical protein
MPEPNKKLSISEMVSQLRQTGNVPSLHGVQMSNERMTGQNLGQQAPSMPAGMKKSGWSPASRGRSLPREQGKPGPELGMSR